ncbi:DUF6314 family protein [Arthrobacter cupressi]|uniref:DUF6314 domain-containing protein n=1 Tax=Arthrobacter cupressi TaxID=1045773 RepID=A0A1G8I0T8_9MICC|nr:DUF6314 family protein [Arthrobacter cupressi]NYD78867.1 hypothetical protein [Arthrobacter cupressi]SDI12566.1 hypothetical protein SAMN05216555_10195 [Arthrobacter cupressi]
MTDTQPVPDLRAWLTGGWTVERTLWDRGSGTRGTFTGVAHYSETPDGGLHYREHGTLSWGDHSGPASREYLLRPADTPDAMDMFFPDGRPFHRFSFGPDASHDRHWCDPDDYAVDYRWLGPDSFAYSWDVHGPAKDLLLESVLRREP